MPSLYSTECPFTGLECPGKAFLIQALEAGQIAVARIDFEEPAKRFRWQRRPRNQALDEATATLDNVKEDLASPCEGEVCGPLVNTSSRYINPTSRSLHEVQVTREEQ